MTNKKTKWQLEQEKLEKERVKAMTGLTEVQLKAIKEAHIALKNVLTNINDIEDIYLSDIRAMNESMWDLRHQFNLHQEEND
jgi:hypothetical protein